MGSGSSKPRITAQDRAILDLKLQRDRLKQYQKKLNQVLARETEIAKAHLERQDKRRALLALRKKKYQEQLLHQTEEQIGNLETMTQTIEFSLVERDVLKGLARGNQVLKELHREMSLENVEKLVEETADALAYQEEVEVMLSGKISTEEEATLERELDRLAAEAMSTEAVDTRPVRLPQLPDAPSHQPLPVKATKVVGADDAQRVHDLESTSASRKRVPLAAE
ncbi:Vacuolar protein sorting-associated protein 20 [Dispira parvispora]|uniref:Vacuolar protein sorting-associated protein 20 n=1 Tax=Dispira parvispora TaxID=1520584 RepID=A0A9W8AVF9_9FUNG|nr:Vacuolar protein sorting-associated protein 20 [Dispira parvispora]